MHVAPPVPDMEFDLNARTFGGQYMQDTELRVRFAQQARGTVRITAEDSVGAPRADLVLDDESVQHLFDTLSAAIADGLSTDLGAGLTRDVHFQIGCGEDDIDLVHQLDQIHEWLKYERGVEFWDPANPTWEY